MPLTRQVERHYTSSDDSFANNPQFLDLFGEDSWRNVYARELEMRPPGAPTTQDPKRACGPPWRVASAGSNFRVATAAGCRSGLAAFASWPS